MAKNAYNNSLVENLANLLHPILRLVSSFVQTYGPMSLSFHYFILFPFCLQ